MIGMYELLPEFYREADRELGYPLKTFLEVFQEVLEGVYEDEKALRTVQDPDLCPERFLDLIAWSLDWEWISRGVDARRHEAKEIVNFYDLKGTSYAIRLFARLAFGDLFKRLYELYEGGEGSVSGIRYDYDRVFRFLRELLEGNGTFADPSWASTKEALRGRPYGFDKEKRLWSYVVYNQLFPEEYSHGSVRPRYRQWIRQYRRWHPAGRFCYVFITMPSFDEEGRKKGDMLLAELAGVTYLDSFWSLDGSITWDNPGDPVHPSLSYVKTTGYQVLDSGRVYDDGTWHWDELQSSMNIIVELD